MHFRDRVLDFRTILATALLYSRIQAADHYCANNGLIDITIGVGQEEKLFPFISKDDTTNVLRCRWKISATSMPDSAMLVLSGFNANSKESSANANSPKMQYQLQGSTGPCTGCSDSECKRVVDTEDTYRVMQLSKGSHLTVTYEQDSSTGTLLPPGLMVQLVEKDFCSRDMVNFEQRCYRISTASRSLMDELSFMRDSNLVQLASFATPDAIKRFVEISKRDIFGSGAAVRSKVPLALQQPVRIGVFALKCKGNKSVSYLTAAGGKCLVNEAQKFTGFNFTDLSADSSHACGSLRVDQLSGREILEFRNCNEPLPALTSFAETPRDACSSCSEPVVNWLDRVIKYDCRDRRDDTTWLAVLISALIGGLFLIALLIAIVIAIKRKHRNRRRKKIAAGHKDQEASNELVNAL